MHEGLNRQLDKTLNRDECINLKSTTALAKTLSVSTALKSAIDDSVSISYTNVLFVCELPYLSRSFKLQTTTGVIIFCVIKGNLFRTEASTENLV